METSKKWLVYLITNSINEKSYVGKTSRPLHVRWREHITTKPKDAYLIHKAIGKYGDENFTIEVLNEASDDVSSCLLEKLWIITLGTFRRDTGYNLTYGGDGVPLTDEIRWKQGSACRGKKLPPMPLERRLLISKARKGKPSKNKGKPSPLKGKPGKPKTEEHKKKLSDSKKGKPAPWTKQLDLYKDTRMVLSRKAKDKWSKLTKEERSLLVRGWRNLL